MGGTSEDDDGCKNVGGIKLFGAMIMSAEEFRKKKKKMGMEEEEEEEEMIACPRCKSMETKFCYFNNYNVNQPRHFCKACHRYWTAGGALRNVPVGAGRRKSKPPPYHLHEWHTPAPAPHPFKRRRPASSDTLTCA